MVRFFQSFSPIINPSVSVPSAQVTIGVIVTFMFHSLYFFFSSLARFKYFSQSYSFTQWSAGMAKSTIRQGFFFFWLSLGLVVRPRLDDLFVSQNTKEFGAFHFSLTASELCIYHLAHMVKFRIIIIIIKNFYE